MFNGIYSRDMNISICTVDSNDFFNEIGVQYSSNITIENDLVDYHPYFSESFAEAEDIELNLLVYDPITMEALNIKQVDMEEIYDWLITDGFVPFVSDDDLDLIYYMKVTRITKVLTFNGTGYLNVVFKPYSKYAYRRRVYDIKVDSSTTIDIFNYSRQIYKPIIEITNLGDKSTVNKVNDLTIVELDTNEKVIIDNLSKIIQDKNGLNKFNCCINRKWIELLPREKTTLTLSGNCNVKIICEFPVIT